ncbi:hypothetical protein [Peptostreptococcus stomatis]|uniref:hypothetical protein n=2 Tax=Peptostreptococcus stomatis TaxID=341694 RepID=UPI001A4BF3A3|nr:hypothetical protein [Peptostreptococcus stomatis]MBL6466313.1 hypothetical protein [Peptostreptococcus stomatis]
MSRQSLKRKKQKIGFIEMYFRFVSLLFWPIYWYKWTVITVENLNNILFKIYGVIDLVFIFLLVLFFTIKRRETLWYFIFSLSMSTCYLVSLYSFIMVPVDINWLYIKIGTIIVTMIISWNLLKRDGNDIGVVGLLSGVLLLIMTYFY